MKKLFIKTYGCQMNVYDSERMTDVLAPLGYSVTDTIDEANLIILNTCHIREKAAEKVYSELGRIAPLKKKNLELLAVAGCVGQAEGELLTKRAPYVDIVLGPQSYHRLPEMVTAALRREGHVIDLEFSANEKFDALPEETSELGRSAFLSVQEGCDKFCTFCVVPYTRGAEYSRPVSAIMREAIQRVSQGVIEITLLGQNVNAYHGENIDGGEASLPDLIRLLSKIDGLERIRYTTSHPRDMTNELLSLHGEEPKLMPYLHLPIQAGSDNVLKMMNRKHTAEDYLRIIDKLRRARPDIALSSDFIVGFPGETDLDFEDTLALVKEVGYASAYSFKYSPRPGTPAAGAEQVPEEVKVERLQRLQALLNSQQEEFNKSTVGMDVPVLLEREGKRTGQLVGKSPYLQSVLITDSTLALGDLVNVTITDAYANSVSGILSQPIRNAA